MQLKNLYVRFYRSFNFDYLRKFNPSPNDHQFPWEFVDVDQDKQWLPFVTIPIDPSITIIVGANESGKSHLLDAIEKGVSGKNDAGKEIQRKDFCRYSDLFTVSSTTSKNAINPIKKPDFGFEWELESRTERETFKRICQSNENIDDACKTFWLFRINDTTINFYVNTKDGIKVVRSFEVENNTKINEEISNFLPIPFRIKSTLELPDSVPIARLIQIAEEQTAKNNDLSSYKTWDREFRGSIANDIDEIAQLMVGKRTEKTQNIFDEKMAALGNKFKSQNNNQVNEDLKDKARLAYHLLCRVAKVDVNDLRELAKEMTGNDEGFVKGIIEKINQSLAENLNFPSWWVQDKDFKLVVSAKDYDLGFAIRDKTGSEYSFAERSSGLKYFLSYYIQYKAHEQPQGHQNQILLMDEPDQCLSSQAQQNLLKIFKGFSEPEEKYRKKIQVIYVTHSPFLIDKNHPDRVRVLEKGIGDEGTRVVNNFAKNHYEPLRSAFGALCAETTFIGNCNLILKDIASQVLLTGLATYLRFSDEVAPEETLDLNELTMISAENIDNIPDLVYLARGRDIEKPAIVILLDNTQEKKSVCHKLKDLDEKYVISFHEEMSNQNQDSSDLANLFDLIPARISIESIFSYLREQNRISPEDMSGWKEKLLVESNNNKFDIFQALKQVTNGQIEITPLAVSRSIVDYLHNLDKKDPQTVQLIKNSQLLFNIINSCKDKANLSLMGDTVEQKIKRHIEAFIQDHRDKARKSQACNLLDKLETFLDDSQHDGSFRREIDAFRNKIKEVRLRYKLSQNLNKEIEDYNSFKRDLVSIYQTAKISSQKLINQQFGNNNQEEVFQNILLVADSDSSQDLNKSGLYSLYLEKNPANTSKLKSDGALSFFRENFVDLMKEMEKTENISKHYQLERKLKNLGYCIGKNFTKSEIDNYKNKLENFGFITKIEES